MEKTTQHNLLAGLIAVFGVLFTASGQRVFSAERIVIATPSRGLSVFPALVSIRKGFARTKVWKLTWC